MKVFVAYRFTGEDPKELHDILGNIRSRLETRGHEVYCSFFEEDFFRERRMDRDQIYNHCMQKLDESDAVLVFVKSNDASKGISMETERASQQRKRIVLAIRQGLDQKEIRDRATELIEYRNYEELYRRLEGFR